MHPQQRASARYASASTNTRLMRTIHVAAGDRITDKELSLE